MKRPHPEPIPFPVLEVLLGCSTAEIDARIEQYIRDVYAPAYERRAAAHASRATAVGK